MTDTDHAYADGGSALMGECLTCGELKSTHRQTELPDPDEMIVDLIARIEATFTEAMEVMVAVAKDAGMEKPEPWAKYAMLACMTGAMSDAGDEALEHLVDTLNECRERGAA